MNSAPSVFSARKALLTFALAAAPVAALHAQAARTAPKPAAAAPRDSFALTAKLPVDPAVRIGTLPNGIRYYIGRNAKP